MPEKVKKSDFLSILYIESLRQFRETKFQNGDKIRISK